MLPQTNRSSGEHGSIAGGLTSIDNQRMSFVNERIGSIAKRTARQENSTIDFSAPHANPLRSLFDRPQDQQIQLANYQTEVLDLGPSALTQEPSGTVRSPILMPPVQGQEYLAPPQNPYSQPRVSQGVGGAGQGFLQAGPNHRGLNLTTPPVTASEEALRLKEQLTGLHIELNRLKEVNLFLNQELQQNNTLLEEAKNQLRQVRTDFTLLENQKVELYERYRRVLQEKEGMERQYQADLREIENKLDELFLKSIKDRESQ